MRVSREVWGRKEAIPMSLEVLGWGSRWKKIRLPLQDSTQQMIIELPNVIPEAQYKCHFFQEALLDVPVESIPSSPLLSENFIFQAQPCPVHIISTLFQIHSIKSLNVFLTIGFWRTGTRSIISVCTVQA